MATVMLSVKDLQQELLDAINAQDGQKMNAVYQKCLKFAGKAPEEWSVWFLLGNWHIAQNRFMEALPYFNRAWDLHPSFPGGHVLAGKKDPSVAQNIGTCYRGEHQTDLARKWYRISAEINGTNAEIWNNLGTLDVNEGRPQDAERELRKAIEISPDLHHAHWNLGLALLEQGKWEEGYKQYGWGLEGSDRLCKRYVDPDYQWWLGQRVDTLVLYGEQGIGDELMYASLIPKLLDTGLVGHLILDCHDRLKGLFLDAFVDPKGRESDVTVVGTRKVVGTHFPWQDYSHINAKLALGDLPRFLIQKESDYPKRPYLKPTITPYDLIGGGTPIGISWVGGAKTTRKDYRSCNLREIMEAVLKEIPDAQFHSLQYTGHQEDIDQLPGDLKGLMHTHKNMVESGFPFEKYGITSKPMEFGDDSHDQVRMTDNIANQYGDALLVGEDGYHYTKDKETAKAICQMHFGHAKPYHWIDPDGGYDYRKTLTMLEAIEAAGGVTISVNNSTVHLAGCAGIPLLTLTPRAPAWRYGLRRADMPYYAKNTVRQFRQTKGGDWGPAMRRAAKAAAKLTRKEVAA